MYLYIDRNIISMIVCLSGHFIQHNYYDNDKVTGDDDVFCLFSRLGDQ